MANGVGMRAHALPLSVLIAAIGMVGALAEAAPAVFWASDPVRAGETVLVTGEGFGDRPAIEVTRLPDGDAGTPAARPAAWPGKGRKVDAIQAGNQSLKFVLPADLGAGVLAYRVAGASGTITGLLNRPAIWWAQGDAGTTATPGGWVRVFGKNLSGAQNGGVGERESGGKGSKALSGHIAPIMVLSGPRTVRLPAQADCWAARATLPKDLPAGTYRVFAHNGTGGSAAWSEPAAITVAQAKPWPATVYSVKAFGADGTGGKNDTAAIQAALAKAEEAGGGVVTFPRGRYQVTDTLKIPRFTVLRGEGRELVALFWPDMEKPLPVLVQGTNSFGVENLTLYASNHAHIITADQRTPDAGDVFIRRVRVRADAFRGHLTAEQVHDRFKAAARISGGDSLQLGGRNVEVTDCDIYGSGRALYLSRVRGGRVANNTFYNGRHGWYCISGSDGLIFEKNRIIGADLMSTGGGLNCLDGSTYSQNVYYANNALSLMHGWDREAMTSDAGGGLYIGRAAAVDGVKVALAEEANPGKRDWAGAAMYIHDGRGQGQYRRILSVEGKTVTLERPFQVAPDENSAVSITMLQQHYLVVGNQFSDSGIAVQFYGISMEHVIAGNRCERAGGYQAIGKPYGGYHLPPDKNPCQQPSWYCQFLDNTIAEGSIYRSGANNAILAGDSVIGVFGWPLTKEWKWPYNRGAVLRRNHLGNNAAIHIGGSENRLPTVRDVVVENNTITDGNAGLRVDGATAGVLARGNRFARVREPLLGAGADRVWLPADQRANIELARLRSLLRDVGLSEDPTAWPEVRAALAKMRTLPAGAPEVAAGAAAMMEAALVRVAKARETVPLAVVAPYLGLQVNVAPDANLTRVLHSGAGGEGNLLYDVSVRGARPSWSTWANLELPPSWKAGQTGAIPLEKGPARLEMLCVVPAGTWGRVEFPGTVTVGLRKGASLRLSTRVSFGAGFLREWMVAGPFPNKSGQPLDLTLYPPEDGIDLNAEMDAGVGKDVAAQTAAGKIRWQPVRRPDQWLDLGGLFRTKEPGVAYAAACVNAEKETPAVLRLGSSGGVALILNGQYLWSSNASRGAAPDQERVPITLRAGDNVLLFKLCTNTAQWRFTAELAPPAGGFAGTLKVVPPDQFAGRPAFAPPARPVATASGEVKYPAGVNWRLVYADDFDRTALGGRWRPASGKWECGAGILRASGDHAFLAYTEKVKPPVRIEYDTRVPAEQAGDLSAFWLSDPTNYGSGLLVGFGSNGNTTNKILVDGAEVATAPGPNVKPGKWHHVIVQILANGQVQQIVDDQLSLNYPGKPSAEGKHPGLWTWGSDGVFTKVRLLSGG